MSDYTLTENQERWLRELESGNRKQGRGTLNLKGAFCCIGLAAELFKTSSIIVEEGVNGSTSYDGNSKCAPGYVIEALKLRSSRGEAKSWQHFWSLVEMNDKAGLSFSDIAATVRANPEEYFHD